jgi:peptidoglycan/xylan/chitin deacetylase (PgdA/CDA1 family)
MYHRVNDNPDCLGLTVTPELFSLHLKYLKDNYKITSLSQAISLMASGLLSDNYCVVTFDDGYRDNYQVAAPLLNEHGVPATIFVTYDAIESGEFGWGAFDRTLLTTKAGQIDINHWGLGKCVLANKVARENALVSLHRLLKKLPDAEKKEIVTHVIARYGDKVAVERRMMNWPEVCELSIGNLITIGAHTMTHPILSRILPSQARHEIVEAKHLLEKK